MKIHSSGLDDNDIEELIKNPVLSELYDRLVFYNPHMRTIGKDERRIAFFLLKDLADNLKSK